MLCKLIIIIIIIISSSSSSSSIVNRCLPFSVSWFSEPANGDAVHYDSSLHSLHQAKWRQTVIHVCLSFYCVMLHFILSVCQTAVYYADITVTHVTLKCASACLIFFICAIYLQCLPDVLLNFHNAAFPVLLGDFTFWISPWLRHGLSLNVRLRPKIT